MFSSLCNIALSIARFTRIVTSQAECDEALHWALPFIGAVKYLWIVFSFNVKLNLRLAD